MWAAGSNGKTGLPAAVRTSVVPRAGRRVAGRQQGGLQRPALIAVPAQENAAARLRLRLRARGPAAGSPALCGDRTYTG